jgi:elongator complex protein 3
MATAVLTTTKAQARFGNLSLAPENERFLQACADIASVLIRDYEAKSKGTQPKRDINLNSLRTQISKQHKLSNIPPLTSIIAAIPEHYKKYILPTLVAKPIRTL